MSRINRAPLSLSRLARHMKKPTREGMIAVVVGTITNDVRLYKVPKLSVAALHVTEKARARILAAGGVYCCYYLLREVRKHASKYNNYNIWDILCKEIAILYCDFLRLFRLYDPYLKFILMKSFHNIMSTAVLFVLNKPLLFSLTHFYSIVWNNCYSMFDLNKLTFQI